MVKLKMQEEGIAKISFIFRETGKLLPHVTKNSDFEVPYNSKPVPFKEALQIFESL